MVIVLFGATGMVGQGVLRACLEDPSITRVLVVGRSRPGIAHPRLEEFVIPDVTDLHTVEDYLVGVNACFFPLGVSSVGMTEADYERVTYTLTLSVAEKLASINPGMAFVYVSGAYTDSSEHGRTMWARVKGRTENALLKLPLRAYMFRPGIIQPLGGIRSKTAVYRLAYLLMAPLLSLLRRLLPNQILTTRQVGRAMIAVARSGYPRPVLEIADIRAAAGD